MLTLVSFLITFTVFIVLEYIAYFTTKKELPEFINHKPFNCRKCQQFWSNIIIATIIYISFNCIGQYIFHIILTILETIALIIDERERTVNDYNDNRIN